MTAIPPVVGYAFFDEEVEDEIAAKATNISNLFTGKTLYYDAKTRHY